MAVFQPLIENRTSAFDHFSFLTCSQYSNVWMHSGFPEKIQKWPNLAKNWPKLAVSGQNLAIFAIFLVENIEKFYFLFFVQKWKKIDFGRKKWLFCLCDPPYGSATPHLEKIEMAKNRDFVWFLIKLWPKPIP